MNNARDLLRWQLYVAVVGFFVWLLMMSSAELIKQQGWLGLYRFLSGYTLGFIIVFAGFLFCEIMQGRGRNFVDSHSFFRWLSYIFLTVTISIGLLSLAAQIFGKTDWHYNIGSVVGGFVVSVGLRPVIEKYDWRTLEP